MAIANKALVWSLFAAGGTLTAFLFPAVIAVFLMISTGYIPDGLSYVAANEIVASWFAKTTIFGIIFLSIWHAAHRARVVFHDFGVRADGLIAIVLYSLATIATILAALVLVTMD